MTTQDHGDTCRTLQAINESSRHNKPAQPQANAAAPFATLPKLLALDVTAWPRCTGTFYRGASLRCEQASEWLDLLASGRLARATDRWFDAGVVLSSAVDDFASFEARRATHAH